MFLRAWEIETHVSGNARGGSTPPRKLNFNLPRPPIPKNTPKKRSPAAGKMHYIVFSFYLKPVTKLPSRIIPSNEKLPPYALAGGRERHGG